MITISLCMIVKNEETTLARCLESVGDIADEIIIVDTGSDDHTKEIAKKYTDNIYDFDWIDDFSAARNYSFSFATKDYILWLDADDILLPLDAAKLKELKETIPPGTDTVMLRYSTGFDDEGRVIFSCFRERLSRRGAGFKWREPVHEYLETGVNTITANISVTHAKPAGGISKRNINIYEKQLERGNKLSARGMYYYARELKDHYRFDDAVRWFGMFLDSGLGWVEDNISACGDLASCLLARGEREKALEALLRSFNYDTPRAEICCQIGYIFMEPGKYRQAIFWFELILKLKKNKNNIGFCNEDCWGYIPCMKLVICYDKLGEREKAEKYNEMAAQYKPESSDVIYNRKYFENKR